MRGPWGEDVKTEDTKTRKSENTKNSEKQVGVWVALGALAVVAGRGDTERRWRYYLNAPLEMVKSDEPTAEEGQ
jgi:hypothetical protein